MSFCAKLLGTSCLIVASGITCAQAASDSAPGQVETIIVTAQKRAENLQSVPIAITAISGTSLSKTGITDTKALNVPGLTFTQTASSGTIFLRGIGASAGDPATEPSVATYVDGVYIAAPNGTIFDFMAVDQVAVLKGPQGTLFGRNATGGVIQITTRNPSLTKVEAEAHVGYANYNTWSGDIYASVPLSERVGVNIAGQYLDQSEGYGVDVTTGIPTYRKNRKATRAKVLYEPDDATRVTLSGDISKIHYGIDYRGVNGIVGTDGVFQNIGQFDSRQDYVRTQDTLTEGLSLTIDHDFDAFSVKSITAFRRVKGLEKGDQDATPLFLVNADVIDYQKNWSQEVHLASRQDGPFKWLVGAFYLDTKAGYQPVRAWGNGVAGPTMTVLEYGLDGTRSISGFAQGTYDVTSQLSFTAGIRYTHDQYKHWTSTYLNNGTPTTGGIGAQVAVLSAPALDQQSVSKPTWRLGLDYKITPDILGYFSYNRGIKSGGMSILEDAHSPTDRFGPERIDAYEVGLKTDLLDHALTFNTSAFWYDWKNVQVLIVTGNGTSQFIQSAGAARVRGVDFQLEAVPAEHLTISSGLAYTDGKYTKFPGSIYYGPAGGQHIVDATGRTTVSTPKISGSTTVNYEIPVSSGTVDVSLTGTYTSKFYWTAANTLSEPGYVLLNSSIRWTPESDRFSVTVWAKNLTNHYYAASHLTTPAGDYYLSAEPRTYGVRVGAKF